MPLRRASTGLSSRAALVYAAKLVFSAALLAALLSRTPLESVFGLLAGLDAPHVLAVALSSVTALVLSAVRLRVLLPEYPIGTMVQATFSGFFYGMVLPGQVAGDVVKAYRLGRDARHKGRAEAATLLDRGIAALGLLCIGCIGTVLVRDTPTALRAFFALGVAGVLALGLVLASRTFHRLTFATLWSAAPSERGRISNALAAFAQAMHEGLRQPSRMLANFLLALLFHAIAVVNHVVLAHGLGITIGAAEWAVAYASVSLALLLPVTIAGIGLRESGYVAILGLYAVPSDQALSFSFALLAFQLFLALLGFAGEMTYRRSRVHGAEPD